MTGSRWESIGKPLSLLLFWTGILSIPIGLVLPTIFSFFYGEPPQPRECRNNLRNVLSALLHYEQQESHFPPAHPRLPNGTPGYSWRLLLLNYLDQPSLFRRFDFKASWNSDVNRAVVQSHPMQGLLRCPTAVWDRTNYWNVEELPNDWTSYVVVTGPGTAFPDDGTTRLSDIKDDPATTILVIEWPNSDIHWAEPRDVTHDEAVAWFRKAHADPGLMPHLNGIHVGFANGHVRQVPAQAKPEAFAAALTIAGGERITEVELFGP